jgi:hypothetical protein
VKLVCPCGRVYTSVDVPLGTHASVVCRCGRQHDFVPRRVPQRLKEALGALARWRRRVVDRG